jgi:hypothetical protein
MSSTFDLYAHDTPLPFNPDDPGGENDPTPSRPTVDIASAGWCPVFWCAGFNATEDMVDVASSEGTFPAVVAPLESVRARLAERDGLVRDVFPAHIDLWTRWRACIDRVDRLYLHLETYSFASQFTDPDETALPLFAAISWFSPRAKRKPSDVEWDFTNLLRVAELAGYDPKYHLLLPTGRDLDWHLVGGSPRSGEKAV